MKYSPELVSEERKENIYKHAKRKDRHSFQKNVSTRSYFCYKITLGVYFVKS